MRASPVVWSEGLFLKPQHFQQMNRYIEQQFLFVHQFLGEMNYGIFQLAIDQALLRRGEFLLLSASGVMPDGTPFVWSDPLSLKISRENQGQFIFLSLPKRRYFGKEVGNLADLCRYKRHTIELEDVTEAPTELQALSVARFNFALSVGETLGTQEVGLAIARVESVQETGAVRLEAEFIPACLDIRYQSVLQRYLTDVQISLEEQQSQLKVRQGGPGELGKGDVRSLFILQLINRYQSCLVHLQQVGGHPEKLFGMLSSFISELAALTTGAQVGEDAPVYRQDDLSPRFAKLVQDLTALLRVVCVNHAVQLAIQEDGRGVRLIDLTAEAVLTYSQIILLVRCASWQTELQSLFLTHSKLGPSVCFKELMARQLPGINLICLSVAPRQIPYQSAALYLELDQKSDLWSRLSQAPGLSLYIGKNIPGLEVECWAIC